MTDRTPEETPSPSSELRTALIELIEAIDGTDGMGDTGELRRLAVEQLGGIERRAGTHAGAGVPGEGGHDHEGPIEALRDALHRFETDHPVLTRAINDVSHFLSGMGI